MPVTYTNRRGATYILCKGTSKSGKPRYFFAREPKGEVVNALPEGHQIEESVNGVVSLVKTRPQWIAAEEIASVEAALQRHPQGRNYRVSAKQDQIIIYERQGPDIDALMAMFGRVGPPDPGVAERLNRAASYIPVMRFILNDRDSRAYIAQRWHFSGSIDDWFDIGHAGPAATLARTLIPVLGTDAFFDLG